jgi:hypothetical protein
MRHISRIFLPVILILAVSVISREQTFAATALLTDQRLVVLESFMRPT